MTRDELIDQYFDWMYQLVVDDRYSNKSYRKLFSRLYDTEFTYTIPMDGNRAEDGIDLRYRFGRESTYILMPWLRPIWTTGRAVFWR